MPRYAQHFLVNEGAAHRIVSELYLTPGESVLEIGPGKGALTEKLLSTGAVVVAVEVDPVMVEILQEKFSSNPAFTLLHLDVLDLDPAALEPLFKNKSPQKIVGNLPYNITSPILDRLGRWTFWKEAVLMMQKEVADRLTATSGTHSYGALTLGVALFSTTEPVFDLGPGSFRPPPKVDSSVVRLRRRPQLLMDSPDIFKKVVQAAFQQRRKTLLNSLSHGLHRTKVEVSACLGAVNIPESERPERLATEQFISLTKVLSDHGFC